MPHPSKDGWIMAGEVRERVAILSATVGISLREIAPHAEREDYGGLAEVWTGSYRSHPLSSAYAAEPASGVPADEWAGKQVMAQNC
jgi:hypothetical protein